MLWLICTLSLAVATDHGIVIADFEGDDYGDWTVTGKAFGTSPAHGAIAETDLLKPVGGRIKLHILVDRTSLELFGNDGLLSMSSCILPNDDNKSLAFFCRAGPARLHSLTVWAFKSIWNN